MRHKSDVCIGAVDLSFPRSSFNFEINQRNNLGLRQGTGQVFEVDGYFRSLVDCELELRL
jgi:hypothetical protein